MSIVEEVEENSAGLVDGSGAVLADPVAEAALIGFLLLKPEKIAAVGEEVSAEDFYDPFHRRVFEVLCDAYDQGWAVNSQTVVEAVGGGEHAPGWIASLMANAPLDNGDFDPVDLARELFAASERRAVGEASDSYPTNEKFNSKMGLKLWSDQNAPGEEYEYLVEDLIPERELCLMMGESQTGKSFLGYHLGMSIARGRAFFGRRVLKPRGVIWLAYEAERGATARMRAYRKFHGLEVDDLPFAVLTKPARLWPAEDAIGALINEINGIARSYFGGIKLGLVIVDTHNAGTPGASEIDSEATSKIRENYKRIVNETNAALMLIGHVNAAGKHRGNEQLTNNIETTLRVSRKVKAINSKESVPIKDEEARPIRTMKVQKQREGQDGDEFDFVLHVVEDGTKNKFGKARTSCVVAKPVVTEISDIVDDPRQDAKKTHGVKANKGEQLFVQCVLDATAEQGVLPPAALGLPKAVSAVVDYDAVKRLVSQKMLREEDNTEEGRAKHRARAKKAVQRAREGLMHVGVVGCHDPYIWWTGKPVQGVPATQRKAKDLFNEDQQPDGADDLSDFY